MSFMTWHCPACSHREETPPDVLYQRLRAAGLLRRGGAGGGKGRVIIMGNWDGRAMFCSLGVAAATAGCGPPASPPAGAAAEPSLAEQLTAVRAKESDLIHVEAAPLGDEELDRLVDVPGLRILQLDHADNKLTAAGMAKIARLEQLEHLRIRGGSIGDEGLKNLAGMKNLKILNLPQGEFTDAGLAQLQKLPELV